LLNIIFLQIFQAYFDGTKLYMVEHFGIPHFKKHSQLMKQVLFNGNKLLTLKELQNKYIGKTTQ
jgi:hypothetical protein